MSCQFCQFHEKQTNGWGRCVLSLGHFNERLDKQCPDDRQSPFYAVGWANEEEATDAHLMTHESHSCGEFETRTNKENE